MKIQQDANHIAEANIRSFIDLSNATGRRRHLFYCGGRSPRRDCAGQ